MQIHPVGEAIAQPVAMQAPRQQHILPPEIDTQAAVARHDARGFGRAVARRLDEPELGREQAERVAEAQQDVAVDAAADEHAEGVDLDLLGHLHAAVGLHFDSRGEAADLLHEVLEARPLRRRGGDQPQPERRGEDDQAPHAARPGAGGSSSSKYCAGPMPTARATRLPGTCPMATFSAFTEPL